MGRGNIDNLVPNDARTPEERLLELGIEVE